ncbi:MAG: efflux RND transporter periplasmic adaptor subunit [Litoreibacter sp.]
MPHIGFILIALIFSSSSAFSQSVSAILEPAEMVEIRSAVAGRIETISVTDGASVSRNDLLAQMDASVQKARVALSQIVAQATGAVEKADIEIAQAEQLHNRLTNAYKNGAAKKWEVTRAEHALALTKADKLVALEQISRNAGQLELERATLNEFQMLAPFDGVVLQVHVTAGEIIETDEVLMELGDLSRLSASAFVPFDWVTALEVDKTVQVDLDNGGALDAKIVTIDPRMDPASQSVRVEFEVPNPDFALFAGMTIVLDRP